MTSTFESLDVLNKNQKNILSLIGEIVKKQELFVAYNADLSKELQATFQVAFDCVKEPNIKQYFMYGKKLLKDILSKKGFQTLKKSSMIKNHGIRQVESGEVVYYDSIYVFNEYNLYIVDGFVSLYYSDYLPSDFEIYSDQELSEIAKTLAYEMESPWCRFRFESIHCKKLKDMIQNQQLLE